MRRTWIGIIVCLCLAATVQAEIRLPGFFSDNMVLQQGAIVPIWGWADASEAVTVKFHGQLVKATPVNGKWMVRLKKLAAGGPYEMTVSGKNSITLKNVLVGEVWICSGQSNMQWQLKQSFQPEAAIAAAANPKIRLYTVPRVRSEVPLDDVKASWQECNPQTVPDFSAVAYFFGRDLQQALKVPVGLIHTSWGGSPAEAWTTHATLQANPDYRRDILDVYPGAQARYKSALADWEKETAQLKAEGKEQKRRQPSVPWSPSELYNGMIAPLVPFAFRGGIWYQGEANAGRAFQYRTLMPDMIRDWRRAWGAGDFTFLMVQLAPYDKIKKRPLEEIAAAPVDSDWAELREAQLLTTKVLKNVGMAVITDVGEKDDIHPTKKEPVGKRLAFAARGIAYRERLSYSGPVYKDMRVEGDKVVLSFDHTGAGLTSRNATLQGFAIAGEDRKFVWARAEIRGRIQVVVSSPQVTKPVAVRYGWADYPVVNLWNQNGLPATPFRTDDFPMITAPRK
jgi:sialate O-acetylesterase